MLSLAAATRALTASYALACAGASLAGTLYVSPTGSDLATGSSWGTAVATISRAAEIASAGDEVFVRRGTYNEHLLLDKSLRLFGGFAGTESSAIERPPFPRPASDVNESTINASGASASAITTAPPPSSGTVIDGFTITGGTGTPSGQQSETLGGAVYVRSGLVTVTNCIIRGNTATLGGGIYCVQSMPRIANCTIERNQALSGGGIYGTDVQVSGSQIGSNTASRHGGGAYLSGGSNLIHSSSFSGNAAIEGGGVYANAGLPTITQCRFLNNSATLGAGLRGLDCLITIDRNTFKENIATADGGGAYLENGNCDVFGNRFTGNCAEGSRGGGLLTLGAALRAANCFFDGNCSSTGGAIASYGGSAIIVGNTIAGNFALDTGAGGIAYDASPATISNNIIAYNSSGIRHQGAGTTTLQTNCFYNEPGQDYTGVSPGATDVIEEPGIVSAELGRLHIQPASVCIDKGTASALIPNQKDIDGQARVIGAKPDIGADESDGTSHSADPVVVRVSTSGSDSFGGASWDQAKRTLQAAVELAEDSGGQVWVVGGTYRDPVVLGPYVSLMGGFAGHETEADSRRWKDNPTTLDADGAARAVAINPNKRTTSISGFTITGGTGGGVGGGGILCSAWSSPVISRNSIIDNHLASGFGGGIFAMSQSSPLIANNLIARNSVGVEGVGGGIAVWARSAASIVSNTITDNSAFDGGGIFCNSASPSIVNNIVALNSSGIRGIGTGTYYIRSNNVYNLPGYDYSGVVAGLGFTDVSFDPGFAGGGSYSLGDVSGCINAGRSDAQESGEWDIAGLPRISGSAIDIGCYEYQLPSSTATTVPGARSVEQGGWADVTNARVSAAFDGYFYIQSPERSSGIRVEKPGHLAFAGQVASVVGRVETNPDGERFIRAAGVNSQGFDQVRPLVTISKAIGGAGSAQSVGLVNVGLLVRAAGVVTSVDASARTFTLWDGSAWLAAFPPASPSGAQGIHAVSQWPLPAWLSAGTWASVTGPVSCKLSDGTCYPVVLLRAADELTQL